MERSPSVCPDPDGARPAGPVGAGLREGIRPVLPRPRRVNRADDFRRVLRRGRRAGRRRLSVHVLDTGEAAPGRAGFVVGKVVGPSVVRHRVTRRLRHLLRDRLDAVPAGTAIVVRAHTPAADATSAELAEDLDGALRRLGVVGPRAVAPGPGPADQGRNR